MTRLLITGSREHSDPTGVLRVFEGFVHAVCGSGSYLVEPPLVVVHGACPGERSVDAICSNWANTHGDFFVGEAHPADWDSYGNRAGPIRNKKMVDLGADWCLAFPDGVSRGTRGCASMAVKAGIPTLVLEPEDLKDSHPRIDDFLNDI